MEALVRTCRAALRDKVPIRGFMSSSVCHKSKSSEERRMKRPPINTMLKVGQPERIISRRGYGGTRKLQALYVNSGYYTLESEGVGMEMPILDVVYSRSGAHHLQHKIITKSTVVKLDATLLKERVAERLDGESMTDKEKDSSIVDDKRRKFLQADVIYARVTTQPGQVGACNGYILEGQELEEFLESQSMPN